MYLRRMFNGFNVILRGEYGEGRVTVVKKVKANRLFDVAINDISVIHVAAHRCAGGLKKK